jgi:hypothetical protein
MSTRAAQNNCAVSEDPDWKFESDFASRLYEAVGTPFALKAELLHRNGEYAELCDLSVESDRYQQPTHFAEDYQVAKLLSKSRNIPGSTATKRQMAALAKFLGAEARNAETNDRLWGDRLPHWFGDFSHEVLKIFGTLTPERLDKIADLGKFGPGVNVGVRGDGLVPSVKYDAIPTGTTGLADVLSGLMPPLVRDFWGDNLSSKVKVVPGNVHFTVPKDWETERCAAKEPLWNSYLQSGIGSDLTRRLLNFGVDLHDQKWNQTLAGMAEEWGLATIDLSSASDLICYVLVVLALTYNQDVQGKRWLHLLKLARSPQMKIGKEMRTLEMFSSMGNGFTFPLETILFLSVIRCTVPRCDWCVSTAYGDDMIVPQRFSHQVIERLEFLGFKVNGKKTCLAGTFFESCGTDWFMSQNVRPFFLRRDPESPVPYPLQAANALRAWCIRIYGCLPGRYAGLWRWCKSQVPTVWRHPVPPELGDVGLHVSRAEGLNTGVTRCPVAKAGCDDEFAGWEGFVCKSAKVKSVNRDRRSFGVLTCGLRNAGLPDAPYTHGLEPVRGLFGRIRTEKHVVLWEDDFVWLRL